MKKSVLLTRVVLLLLSAVMLSGLLTAAIYIFVTQRLFVRMRIEELQPIAQTVAQVVADAQPKEPAGGRGLGPLLDSTNKGFLGATLHIFDSEGRSVMNSSQKGGKGEPNFHRTPFEKGADMPSPQDLEASGLLEEDLKAVLAGEESSGIRKTAQGESYLVVGTPITVDGEVTGAVLFSKPLSELAASMNGLNITLVISTLVSFLIMLVPGYFAAKRLAVPIRQMGDVAVAMAAGDFSKRADESQGGEIGELARAMNQFAVESGRLEQTRRDYVANVSHELRTPIAAIRAMGETLRDGMVPTEEKQLLYFNNIVRESVRLSRLVDDLLELSRLQSGTTAMKKQKFDLLEALQSVGDIYGQAATEAEVNFVLRLPETAVSVFSSPDRIEQVLVILLDNAIKHTPAGGTVALSTQLRGETVTVRVQDTGEGIPEEDIAHIFERFYKVDKAHSGGGTGLGLSIAKEVLIGLNERIWVESGADGSTFSFTVHLSGQRSSPEKA